MPDRLIAILTEWGHGYGHGHIQRMALLLRHLNRAADKAAYLCHDRVPPFFPADMQQQVQQDLDRRNTRLIIRDMRDSTEEDIKTLQKASPVLVLDDLGEGGGRADFCLNLLPNPDPGPEGIPVDIPDLFLFGYTFLHTIEPIRRRVFEKTIDFSIYPGADPTGENSKHILSLLPSGASYALFAGPASYVYSRGCRSEFGRDEYASILLSSKVLVAHFGIMLYEARLAGCRIVTINPSAYHSRLADAAPRWLDITNLGTLGSIPENAPHTLGEIASMPHPGGIRAELVYSAITENLDRFGRYLKNLPV
jgi:hypothetical protein